MRNFEKQLCLFCNNKFTQYKATVTKKYKIISSSKDVTETFNTFFVTIFSNLGIVFNESVLDHLLVAKLHANGFDENSLRIILTFTRSYLEDRKQSVTVDNE